MVDESQVMRDEIKELFRMFHLDGQKTVGDFVKESNGGRWPTTYATMKDAVSRYYRFLECMCLSQVDDDLGFKKYSEVTRDGLGEVAHEVTCMSWLREHVPESEASNHTYVKLTGGDHCKSVCLEEVPRANGRGTNSVAF